MSNADAVSVAAVAAALAAGAGLGAAHFLGLWLTVRSLPDARHPVLAASVSFFVRVSVSAVGFVFLARAGGWLWVAAGLAGFLFARLLIVRRVGHSSATTAAAR